MASLRPQSAELMAFFRERLNEYHEIADALRIPSFSTQLRDELRLVLGADDRVNLVEGLVRIGNFGDAADLDALRKSVSLLLKKRGVHLPRGKRTAPGLFELVGQITPVLLHFGLPLTSSERSQLVKVLRAIACEFDVEGDPRNEIRRLIRIDRAQTLSVHRTINKAIARALSSLRVNNPP